MIVKINSDGGWNYYEGDKVSVKPIMWGDRKFYSSLIEYILRPEIVRSEATEKTKKDIPYWLSLVLIWNGEENQQIATDKVGYVLNNEGKTIDKIN